jgi:hypothetical protein
MSGSMWDRTRVILMTTAGHDYLLGAPFDEIAKRLAEKPDATFIGLPLENGNRLLIRASEVVYISEIRADPTRPREFELERVR